MATVKGILVNDGGAPARIINFKADEDISAGECLKVTANGVSLATDSTGAIAGFALTDAADGKQVSVVTGSGVVLYAMCDQVTLGEMLVVDATAGRLENSTADTDDFHAIALETQATAGALTKILVV